MKQFSIDLKQTILRLLTALASTFMIYVGYMFLAHECEMTMIPLEIFCLMAMLGLLTGFAAEVRLGRDALKGKSAAGATLLIGVVVCLGLCLMLTYGPFHFAWGFVDFLIYFVLFLLVWYRAISIYYNDFKFIYSNERFYVHVALLFLANLLAGLVKVPSINFGGLTRITCYYLLLGIILLFQIKYSQLRENEDMQQSKRLNFITLLGLLGIVLLLTSSTAVNAMKKAYLMLVDLLVPVAMLFGYVFQWIVGVFKHVGIRVINNVRENSAKGKAQPIVDRMSNNLPDYSSIIPLISNILTVILLVAATILILRVFYLMVERNFNRGESRFTEDKSFIIEVKSPFFAKMLNHAGIGIKEAMNQVVLNFTADNTGKLRQEYKLFLKAIYKKKGEPEVKRTPKEVAEWLANQHPIVMSDVIWLTEMYEQVRYGERQPEDVEVRLFCRSAKKVLDALC